MTTNAARQPVDLDAFAPSAPAGKGKADPLAELARIVGQDDPFRALLEAQGSAPRGSQARRIEPGFEVPLPPMGAAAAQAAPAPRGGYAAEEAPADAFDRYLAEVERDSAAPAYDEAMPAPEPAAERPRGRTRLMLVGGGLGVCVIAVAGALTWKSMHGPHGVGGGPVMVMADKAPLKVAPQDAGGVEIPDQNKQIYDRSALDGTAQNKVRIVNREEQPLDVQQIARETPAPAVNTTTSTSGAATAAPQPTNALTDSLGEPRRVRTVSVRPEQPPFSRDGQRGADAVQAQQAGGPPTMVLPQAASGVPTQPAPAPKPARTVQAAATPAVPAETPATPAAATPATIPSRPKPTPVQRVASAGNDAVTTASAVATPAPAAASGGFAVQLAVRPTENEARAAFKQMQDRYADLGGRPALIRQAEVNGKTIFRVRVGPLEREDANGLCTKLKGEGGQCFVAKN